MISKRKLLGFMAGVTGLGLVQAQARSTPPSTPLMGLRGSIDAGAEGITPQGGEKASRKLAALIAKAARQNVPVFLPPGNYDLSNLLLPDGARLTGIAGASRLVYSGGGSLLRADGAKRIELSNIVLDGADRGLNDSTQGLVHLNGVEQVAIDNCEITGSSKNGIHMERCGGRVETSTIRGAADCGLYAVESGGLSVTSNTVIDCGNGGILIHRWTKGFDGSIVSGNRISQIGATHGGTGQYGNAINLFRADGVLVIGNQIADAAFSAIRANSASNVQIANNQCFRSGETGIYAEFAFEGAMVAGNVVDGAANGISVVNFNEGGRLATVSNNIVRNLSAAGPYVLDEAIFGVGISAEADTVITGNVVENAPLWGLALGFGTYLRNVVATANVVRQAPVGCAVSVVDGAGSAVISGNLFEGTRNGAIIGHRWRTPATPELARGGGDAAAFSHLTIDGNRID